MYIGGQEHFYLEGQVAFAVPGEDDDVTVHCSSQHPSEIQHKVAHVLGVPSHAVTVEMRRMGGGFGGKESQRQSAGSRRGAGRQADRPARQVLLRSRRRHDHDRQAPRLPHRLSRSASTRPGASRASSTSRRPAAACSIDLSFAIADRAMFHADNTYYLPAARIVSHRCKTHTQSNTAFRGFGGPQGMVAMERVIDEIAHALGLGSAGGAPRQLLRPHGRQAGEPRNLTPYYQTIEDCVIQEIVDELEESSDYRRRRQEIRAWNATSPILKRGLALTPVKFGISFTTTIMNQAGALVHVYTDGSHRTQPRRHRDGPGPQHQGRPGGGRGVSGRHRPHQDHRHHDGQGAQHLGHRRLLRQRSQRHGGAQCRRGDQGAAGRIPRRAAPG